MFNFGLSQTLSSLCFVAISVSILLSLSLPAEAEVNSPTLTVLDMEEMSQIAGGGSVCKDISTIPTSRAGRCRADGSPCLGDVQCGDSHYTEFFSTEYCQNTQAGHDGCWCWTAGNGWKTYNCRDQRCLKDRAQFAGLCKRAFMGGGGKRIKCDVGNDCTGI